MELFIVVIAILFVQVWGAENPLHRDEWFDIWLERINGTVDSASEQAYVFSVVGPVMVFAVLLWFVAQHSYWPLVPVGVIVLLYSFGRGEFSEIVTEYTQACYKEDWESGISRAQRLNVDIEGIAENDWDTLHQQLLEEAAYRGFERMFAILFWFFLLGPTGALFYRLSFMFCERVPESGPAKKALWLMEWPAVRVLGLSFAMTGNFAGCMSRWRESVFCVARPTKMTIGQSVLGALSVDDDVTQSCEVTRKELSLMDRLFRRTLWFWLGSAAIFIIIS
ncbi:MAG: regulatory signaling modulator protein AmpE [Agarilytica sp.]